MSKEICLFDVDGTLTNPGQKIDQWMLDYLKILRPKVKLALVCGSSMNKLIDQMKSENLEKLCNSFDYIFAENGLVTYMNGELIADNDIRQKIGEENIQKFINFCLFYMSKLNLPVKRGTFIELRKGLLNVCPVGRSCSIEERYQFANFDQDHKILSNFIQSMNDNFPIDQYGLKFAVGGQISVNVYPAGWDKTFCLQYLKNYEKIFFFGNKTELGGSDYDLFVHPKTIGHSVNCPEDTQRQLSILFP